jgi:hypothetical protein
MSTISGNVGVGGATVSYSGTASGSTVANSSGNFSITGLSNGSFTITPSLSGYTFSPASQAVVVSNSDITGVNFGTGYSVPDCRVAPNSSRGVQGTLIYDVQTSSNPAVPGTDSRVASVIPINSRTPGTFGPGE